MKIIFMGTPEFAKTSLLSLLPIHDVVAVVTQPDRPKGRGKKMQFSPVKELAVENNITVYQSNNIKKDVELINTLKKLEADIFVVVAYGQILSEEILNIPPLGCINVHGSLLPLYRGSAPIHFAIINGETKTGVTTMYMDKGMDTGDMIIKREMDLPSSYTTTDLTVEMAKVGAETLIETLELIDKKIAPREKQNNEKATYAHMITKELGHIKWCDNSVDIINLIRGINPAHTYYFDEPLKIWKCEPYETNLDGEHGEIVEILKKGLVVKTGDSAVLITEIQGKNGKKMACGDFIRGHKIELNSILK